MAETTEVLFNAVLDKYGYSKSRKVFDFQIMLEEANKYEEFKKKIILS